MRIVYFSHSLNLRTGVGTLSSSIIDGVRKNIRGVEVKILTSEDYLKPGLFSFAKNWFYIRREIKKADIVHVFDGYPYGVIASIVSIGTNKPIIITAVGSGSAQLLEHKGIKARLLMWTYKRARSVVAISQYVAKEIEKKVGITVGVINPGVNPDFWKKKETTNLDTTLDVMRPYFLTQGELKKRKGYSVLLPIMKDVLTKHREAHYVIVANTTRNASYYKELQKLIEELGLVERITFLSDISAEELRAVYQKATGYVLLPQNVQGDVEGFGISILEAGASGVPAIVGRGSGADDTVKDGVSGFLVHSSEPHEVVERLTALLEDYKLHEQLSSGARSWAQSMDLENQTKKYIALYEKI